MAQKAKESVGVSEGVFVARPYARFKCARIRIDRNSLFLISALMFTPVTTIYHRFLIVQADGNSH